MPRIEGLAWDGAAEEHVNRHGVTAAEVEEAVQRVLYSSRSRGYLRVLGQTAAGRYLVVVLDYEDEGVWYPVTARPMTPSERRLLRKRGKGRP